MYYLLLVSAASAAPEPSILMLGNSYTASNDLGALVADLFEGAAQSHEVQALSAGGLTFVDHLDYAVDPGTGWHTALSKSSSGWGWVVLQEQSQIPGFYDQGSAYWDDSLDAAIGLDDLAEARGAEGVFLMTWGRREGDSSNPSLYPDFSTMQAQLEGGYLSYVAETSTDERPTWVAPAGLAFAQIYADAAAAGDPLDQDGLFWSLYTDDGSHPSLAGSYLTACVVFATLSGQTPVGLAAPGGLDAEVVDALQRAAEQTVFEATPGLSYPWSDAGDTGGADSGGPDTGGGDSGDTGVGDTGDSGGAGSGGADSGGSAGDDGSGDDGAGSSDGSVETGHDDTPIEEPSCSCGGGGAGGLWWLAVVAGVARRRR